MKLKRFISALIVFTMVMTCAVCVSADATYNVTTVYELGSDGNYSGNITLNASVAGATPDTFVSYLLVAPVTSGEGEEATTSYEVLADGKNILHIDQATVDASGNAKFDSAKAAFADYEGGKVKFVSSGSDVFTAKETPAGKTWYDTYLRSIDTVSKTQASVTYLTISDNGGRTNFYYVTKDNKVVNANSGTNFTTDRYQLEGFDLPAYYSGDDTKLGNKKMLPIEDMKAWIFDFNNATSRTVAKITLVIKKLGSTSTGKSAAAKTFTIYNNTNGTDLSINGRYKDDITDGKFGTLTIEPGAVYALDKGQGTTAADETKPSQFVTIDAAPIYSTVDFGYGARNSVTFLATNNVDQDIALKITAYPNGTVSHDGDLPAEGEAVELGIYENAFAASEDVSKQFGIQLVDSADTTEYLDADKYDLEATPCVKDENGEWVELDVWGTNYFTVNRATTATEKVAE
jgi:hypothetical protein